MRCPNSRSNSRKACGLKGALPETYRRKEAGLSERSAASRSRRVYMVGTPKNIVKRPVSSAS
jgi:hypothetical protein